MTQDRTAEAREDGVYRMTPAFREFLTIVGDVPRAMLAWEVAQRTFTTPTPQPVSVDEGLVERLREAWKNDVCDAVCDAENGKVVALFDKLWIGSRVASVLAALTREAGESQPITGEG